MRKKTEVAEDQFMRELDSLVKANEKSKILVPWEG